MIGPILGGRSPRIKFNSSVNLVCDGDSLTAGVGGFPWPRAMTSKPGFETILINGLVYTGIASYKNIAVSGQTLRQMNGLDGGVSSDVDGCWLDGLANIYLPWGGTNSLALANRTAAQTLDDYAALITGRKAVHPGWIPIVGTCLPRQVSTQAATDELNARIDAFNALLLANYRAIGAKGIFDVRQAGSPFNVANYQMATFEAAYANGLWADGETNGHTHLSSTGYHALIDQIIIPALKRLPAR